MILTSSGLNVLADSIDFENGVASQAYEGDKPSDSITNDEISKTDSYIIFIKNLIKILSDQVSEKNNRIEILTKKTTRDKLLEYFKQQAQEAGIKTFTIPMSFTELANYLSVDRSAMTREITYLKDDGIIKTNGRRITLLY